MLITEIDPMGLDFDLADEIVAARAAAFADVDQPPWSGDELILAAKYGEGAQSPQRMWTLHDEGVLVGFTWLHSPLEEYVDTGFVGGWVHPDFQRRGHGRALLETARAATDREYLRCRAFIGTAGEQAMRHWGFEHQFSHKIRRLSLTRPDSFWDGFPTDFEANYDLVRQLGPTPETDLPTMQTLREAINDAPDALEFEAYPPQRIRDYEQGLVRRRQTQYTVTATHRETGEPAGITMVCVHELRPSVAAQEDTSVLRAHRGHGLGLALKIEMARWLRAERPEVIATDTWNDATNHHMIAVNERLGASVIAENGAYRQRR